MDQGGGGGPAAGGAAGGGGEDGSIASVPALERRNSGGEVELRSIIGGSALITSSLCGRVREG